MARLPTPKPDDRNGLYMEYVLPPRERPNVTSGSLGAYWEWKHVEFLKKRLNGVGIWNRFRVGYKNFLVEFPADREADVRRFIEADRAWKLL